MSEEKIIGERVNVPFKEVKEDEEETEKEEGGKTESEEKSLEGEVEFVEEVREGFNNFSASVSSPTSTAPVLQPTVETGTEETIEETLENTPTTPLGETETRELYESSVYNMPEYSYEKEAFPVRREMEERKIIVRGEDINEMKRPVTAIEEWPELRQARETQKRRVSDTVVGTEEINRELKLPWEYKEKRRGVK